MMDKSESKAILDSQLKVQDWIETLVASKTDEQLTPQEKHGLLVAGRVLRELAESCYQIRMVGGEIVEVFDSMNLEIPPCVPRPPRPQCQLVTRGLFNNEFFKFWKWFRRLEHE